MADSTAQHIVGRVEDFPPDTRRTVEVMNRMITIFRVGDDFYGIRNRCPHQGGPLQAGRVVLPVDSDGPGDMRMRSDRPPRVACPWHGWEYDLATGESFAGGRDPGIRAYEVTVRPGCDLSETDNRASPEEPLVAETYEVAVKDGEYVVVHL